MFAMSVKHRIDHHVQSTEIVTVEDWWRRINKKTFLSSEIPRGIRVAYEHTTILAKPHNMSTLSLNVDNFITLKLSLTNYPLWREQALVLAESQDLVSHLTNEDPTPNKYITPDPISDPCIISWKMDTIVLLLLSIGNRWSEKVSNNIRFRYLYPVEVRNHGIYVWNRFHLERVEKALSRWKVLYICPFSTHFFRQRLCFFLFSDGKYFSEHGVWIKPMFESKLRYWCKFFPSESYRLISEKGWQ